MKISIVILNYNGSNETINLLKSLKEQSDKNFEIIVVDNASEEADFTALQNDINQLIHSFPLPTRQVGYPQVKIIRNSQNLGFSGGCNVGIRQALKNGADWVVLLNNDTWVESSFMKHLGAILEAGAGIVGLPLEEDNGTFYCGKIQWLKPTLIHIPTRQVGHEQFYAIGGAMAIHKNVFEKIGLLDERYFLYFEDADFSVRAKKAEFNISIASNNCLVYHAVSSSTKKLGSPLLLRYHYRNALFFNLKSGPWYIKFLVWPWSWIIIIKQLGKIIIKQNVKQSRAILTGVTDFYKNKMGHIKV